jgi:hypothetical protein
LFLYVSREEETRSKALLNKAFFTLLRAKKALENQGLFYFSRKTFRVLKIMVKVITLMPIVKSEIPNVIA